MTITNGNVPADYLVTYQGVPVAALIYPSLLAAEADFHRDGYTFSIALPWGGNRPFVIQGEMRSDYLTGDYARFNLSPPPSPVPATAGSSRHGFAKAVDVISNAPLAVRDAIMAKHGFRLWSTSDRNHYEYGNVLTGTDLVTASSLGLAGGNTRPIIDTLENLMANVRIMHRNIAPERVALFDAFHWQELDTDPAGGSPLMAQVAAALIPQAEPYDPAVWAARSPSSATPPAGQVAILKKVMDFDNATGTVYDLTQPAAATLDPKTFAAALAPLIVAGGSQVSEAMIEQALRNVLIEGTGAPKS